MTPKAPRTVRLSVSESSDPLPPKAAGKARRPSTGCAGLPTRCRRRRPERRAGRQAGAAWAGASVATVLFLVAAPAPSQVALEPVEPPRMDHYETGPQAQMAAAQDALDGALAEAGTDPARLAALFGQLGQLYLLYDFMAPAAASLRNAQALAPDDPRWAYYLAIHHRYEGALEEAVAELDRVVALVPNDVAALTHRADIRLELGLLDEAGADYRRLLEADPAYSPAARLGLGRIAFERRDYESAASLFQAALAGQPKGSVVRHHLGLALRRLGRREDAAAQLALNEQLAVTFPDPLFTDLQRLNVSREAHIKRGTAAMRQGHPRVALAAFLEALAALPDDPLTIFNVAMALIEIGEKQEAEARLRDSIAINDNYRDPQYNLALILAERGDLEGAERHFRRAAEIDPEDVEARVRHADILTRLERPEEAVALLGDVVASDAALPLAQLALGAAHQAAGAVEPARAALGKVLEAAPGAPGERAEAHYRLAVLAETTPANGSGAGGATRGGSATGGGDAPTGRAASGAGPPTGDASPGGGTSGDGAPGRNGRGAVEHLRHAIELDPDLAEAHAFLGRLLARGERYAEAASHFGRALARDPANAGWHRDRAMALILGKRYAAARGGLASARRSLAGTGGGEVAAADHLDTLLARLLSASPDPSVRNGAEALAIAERLMSERPSLQHAETVAMALAETGDFEAAAAMQMQVLDEVGRRGGAPTAGQSQRLAAYLNGEPAREPWFSP